MVVGEPGGWIRGLLCADRSAALAVPGLGDDHLADRAGAELLDRPADHRSTAGLRPHLHGDAVAAGRLDHQPPLAEVVAGGLLHIDMLSRVGSKDRGGAVPMIGGGDPDSLHLVVGEHVAEIVAPLRLDVAGLDNELFRGREPVGIDIAHPGHAHILAADEVLEMGSPHAARADDGHRERCGRLGGPHHRRRQRQRHRCRPRLQDLSSCFAHGSLPRQTSVPSDAR